MLTRRCISNWLSPSLFNTRSIAHLSRLLLFLDMPCGQRFNLQTEYGMSKTHTFWRIHIHLSYLRKNRSRNLRNMMFLVFLLFVFFGLLFSWLVLIGQNSG